MASRKSTMKLVAVFVAAAFLLSTVFAANTNRILNGTQTPSGIFKFIVAWRSLVPLSGDTGTYTGTVSCTSTIISPRHILIAAHCYKFAVGVSGTKASSFYSASAALIDERPMEKMITNGTKFWLPLKKYGYSTKAYVHPQFYAADTFSDDIAIIEFPKGTNFGIPPIKLASDYQEKDGDFAIAAGYGVYKKYIDPKTGKLVTESPGHLRNLTVAVHSTRTCPDNIQVFKPLGYDASPTICAGSNDYRADSGDSGGPLFVERNGEYYQLGIASFVAQNAFYTRLSLQCDWIAAMTTNEVNCVPLPPSPVTVKPSVVNGTASPNAQDNNNTPPQDSAPDVDDDNGCPSFSLHFAGLLAFLFIFY